MKKGYLLLFLASFCYGIMGILIRLLGGQFAPLAQVFIRYTFVAILSVLIILQKKKFSFPKSMKQWLLLIITCAGAYGFTNVFFTLAVLNTTLASTFFLVSTYGVMGPILSVVFLKEKLSRNVLIAMLLAIMGSYFLFNPSGGTVKGAVYALISALLFSLYFIGRKKLKSIDSFSLMVFLTGLGAVSVGISSLVLEKSFYLAASTISIFHITPFSWFILLLFVLDTYATWWLASQGMALAEVSKGSLILLLESIWGTLLGVLFYAEPVTSGVILGAILILSASILAIKS